MKILTDAELPPNTTVELRVEGDEHMDIFLTDEKEQEQEVNNSSSSQSPLETTDSFTSSSTEDETSSSDNETIASSSSKAKATIASTSSKAKATIASTSSEAKETIASSSSEAKETIASSSSKAKPKATPKSTPKSKTNIQVSTLNRAETIEELILPARQVIIQPQPAASVQSSSKTIASSVSKKAPIEQAPITDVDECHRCLVKTRFRKCDNNECNKRTCLNCFGTKVNPSDAHFCSRKCQNNY